MHQSIRDERLRRRGGPRTRRGGSIGDDFFRGLVAVAEGGLSTQLATRSNDRLPKPADTAVEEGSPADRSGAEDELLGSGRRVDYNAQEAQYSSHVRNALLGLLRGDRDELELLVKHHREPNRLGILAVPQGVDARSLRPSRAQEMLRGVLRFLHDGSAGGPISQAEDEMPRATVQTQDFPTRFPHIVIQRTDHFDGDRGDALKTSWSIRRLQNQQSSIQTNRTLDALNLGVEVLKFVL